MKTQWLLSVILGAAVTLTGCGKRSDLYIQDDAVPVVPIETALYDQADHTDDETDTTTAEVVKGTAPLNTVTSKFRTEASAQTTRTAPVTEAPAAGSSVAKAAETAALQKSDGSDHSGDAVTPDQLSGKWETVSFSKDSGARVSYDLSDPVHRSYYVGLDLNETGQSSITVGTEDYPAATLLRANSLNVTAVNRETRISMDFTVSPDRKSMTVELVNGRITATLKRISRDFSIRQYEEQASDSDFSAISGDWNYQEEDPLMEGVFMTAGFVTIQPDGKYIYQPADGAPRRSGTLRTLYTEYADGGREPYFAFYEDDNNTLWVSTDSSEPNGRGRFSLGNSGTMRLTPWNLQDNQFDRFVGQWQSDKCSIQIGRDRDTISYIVRCTWMTDASEYSEWIYRCDGNYDKTTLECTGGGTLVHVVTAPNGTETRTEVYNDGTAVFRMDDSSLFWTDYKENAAQQMEFSMPG